MEERRIKILLLLIIILSFFLRFYKLTTIPASLNPDEKYNGYLAYSLLTTGKDLWGNYFPLAIKTFGSWTLPAYPYLTMIPVAIFGLTDFSARLVGAVFGVAGSVAIYYLADELFKKKKIALISAFLFALSPWSLFMSRISHEVNVAAVFFMVGLLALLKKKYSWAAILFGLTMFTHYAFVIFTPLFLVSYFILKRKFNWKFAVIFSVFLAVSVVTTLGGSAKEVKDVGLLNDPGMVYWRVDRFRTDGAHTATDAMMYIHNRYFGAATQFFANYTNTFSPSFLFDKGGEKILHNTGFTGVLYPIEFFFLLIGAGAMLWKREKMLPVLIAWLFLSPIPSAITKDAPSSTRLYTLMPLLVIFSSYGVYWLSKFRKIVLILIPAVMISTLIFMEFYFVHVNIQRAQFFHYGYKEVAMIAQKYPKDKVVMVGPENFPFIAFLFYNKYDPNKFRQEVTYYPTGSTGFEFVKSFGKYEFVTKIDRNNLDTNTLYFDSYKPGDKDVIKTPGGEKLFSYFTSSTPWIYCGSKGIGCD